MGSVESSDHAQPVERTYNEQSIAARWRSHRRERHAATTSGPSDSRGTHRRDGPQPEVGGRATDRCRTGFRCARFHRRAYCPSSLVHFHPMRLSGVRAYIDGEAHRPAGMRQPHPFHGVRSTALLESPFLARDVFDPRGSSQRTSGSRVEADVR